MIRKIFSAVFISLFLFAVDVRGDLLFCDGDSIQRYNDNGNFVSTFVDSGGPVYGLSIKFGPDGNVYVGGFSEIFKFSYPSGEFLGVVAESVEHGEYFDFDANGDLFVLDSNATLKQFDLHTGFLINSMVLPEISGDYSRFIEFDPVTGDLFASSVSEVNRYTPTYNVANIIENVELVYSIRSRSGNNISEFEFGPSGKIYVTETGYAHPSSYPTAILEYDIQSGLYERTFSNLLLGHPQSLLLKNGKLYSSNITDSGHEQSFLQIVDTSTNQLLQTYGLQAPGSAFAFIPDSAVLVNADVAETIKGQHVDGTVEDFDWSDDSKFAGIRNNGDLQSRVHFELHAISPSAVPSVFTFIVEASVFARSEVLLSTDLFNYDSGTFEEVDSRPASRFIDATTVIDPSGDLSRFVEAGTSNVKARIRFESGNARQRFAAHVDQAIWTIGD